MLKNIPPILSPELLKVLCEMGHGDEIILADGNFPAESIGSLPFAFYSLNRRTAGGHPAISAVGSVCGKACRADESGRWRSVQADYLG